GGKVGGGEGGGNRRGGKNGAGEHLAGVLKGRPVGRGRGAIYDSGRGRPASPPLVLFKCLLLQQWYQLSDAQLEEALADRLSFRRFAGLPLDQEVPDHSTISRFRAQLAVRKLGERLFAELNRQLEVRGFLLKKGTLIDATLIAAAVNPTHGAQSTAGGTNPQKPHPRLNQSGARALLPSKGALGEDQESGVI